MSAVAALFARTGDLNPDEICELTSALTERGPHGRAVWQNRVVALGHAALRILPEDGRSQPVRDGASGSAVVFDGRLDARTELAAACDVDRNELDLLSDAELLLRAYLSRGESILPQLLGDFAFALWDEPKARLICARDVLGLRPLFYCVQDAQVVVASELQAVLRGRSGNANLGMVAEALTCMPVSCHETMFDGVYRIPPGHMLIAQSTGVRVVEFVRLEAPSPQRYATESEYAEQFRDVLTVAVRDRLRTRRKAAVMLSGGIDSSTVFVVARQWADVDGYTVAYDESALDESHVARATVALNGGRHHRAGVSAHTYDYATEIDRYRDLPTNPSGGNSAALRRVAAQNGVDVLLNGAGGDECFLGHCSRWADWLRSGAWRMLWTDWKGWRYSADAVPWHVLAAKTVRPLVPAGARRVASALRPNGHTFAWVRKSLLRRADFVDRVRRRSDVPAKSYAVAGMIHGLVDADAIAAWEEQERLAARFHQDERMPYLDRRVIAFALGLPEMLRSRPGHPKSFTRAVWPAQLPAGIINPYDAPDYTIHVVDALEALGGRALFDDLAIADEGWVDAATVRTMSEQLFGTARVSREFIGHAWKLWAVAAVDGWYRRALH